MANFSYYYEDERLFVQGKDDEEPTNLCEHIEVVGVTRNVVTGEETVSVWILKNGIGTRLDNIRRTVLINEPVTYFSQYGLVLANTYQHKDILSRVLLANSTVCPIQNIHNVLGYHAVNGVIHFFADTSYPKGLCSKYANDTDGICHRGTFDSWLSDVKEYIKDSPELQLALVIGAVAPVNTAIHQRLAICPETPMFAFIGASSTGKTTALKLAASIWGKPEIGSGIIKGALDTDNYVFESISGRMGFPYFVDDSSVEPKKDFTRFIYQISTGSNKGRLSKDCTKKSVATWHSAVVITGETSILAQTNQNKGLFVRLIEFSPDHWTKDAKTSKSICSHVLDNYGTAWESIIDSLMRMSDSDYEDGYNICHKRVKKYMDMQKCNLAAGTLDRITSSATIILFTVHILHHAWNVNFNYDAILKLVVDSCVKQFKNDPVEMAYEAISEYALSQLKGSNTVQADPDGTCVWIAANEFRKKFKECTGFDFSVMAKKFEEKNYIRKYNDSYTVKHRVHSADIRCYCLKMSTPATVIPVPLRRFSKDTDNQKLISSVPANEDDLMENDLHIDNEQ